MHWNLARELERAGPRPHHEGPLHQPPGRRRRARRSTTPSWPRWSRSTACRRRRRRCTASCPRWRSASRPLRPDARLAYVMTDGAGLPLALSDLVADAARPGAARRRPSRAGTRSAATTRRSRVLRARRGPPRRRRRRRRRRPWARGSWAPTPGSGSAAWRSGRSSTPRSRSAGSRSPACGSSFADPRARHRGLSTTAAPRCGSRSANGSGRRPRSSASRGRRPARRPRAPPASTGGTSWSASSRPTCSRLLRRAGLDVDVDGPPGRRRPALFLRRRRGGALARHLATGTDRVAGAAMADRLERLTNLIADAPRHPPAADARGDRRASCPATPSEESRTGASSSATRRRCGGSASRCALEARATHFEPEMGYRIPPTSTSSRRSTSPPRSGGAARRGDGGPARRRAGRAEALWKLGGPRGRAATRRWPRSPPFRRWPCSSTPTGAGRRSRSGTGARPGTWTPGGSCSGAGHWYVVGHDHDRGERRSFRVDRIDGDVEVGRAGQLRAARRPRPRRSAARRARGASVTRSRSWPALLVDAEQAGWVVDAGRRGRRRASGGDDGSVVVALPVTNRAAFRSFALGLLEPPRCSVRRPTCGTTWSRGSRPSRRNE